MKDAGWHVGMAQRQNPFLQIPLHEEFHVGNFGIDIGIGVQTWEKQFGSQMEHLHRVSEQLGYDVFRLAQAYKGMIDAKIAVRGSEFELG